MQMETEYKYYTDLQAGLKVEKKALDKSYSNISVLRLISFCLGAGLVAIGLTDSFVTLTVCGVCVLVFFFYLVYRHGAVAVKIKKTEAMLEVAERYICRFGDGWHEFNDDGGSYAAPDDVVAHDVDLLGPNSLYQMINVCHTELGKMELANELKLNNIDVDSLDEKSAAVLELTNKKEFGVSFEAAGIVTEGAKKKINIEEFMAYCSDEALGIIPKWCIVLMLLLPVVEIGFIVMWVVGAISYGLPLIGFIFNLSVTWLTKAVTDKVIYPVYSISNAADGYMDMLDLIANEQFDAGQLKALHNAVVADKGIVQGFRQLGKIVQSYNISFNPLVHQLLSGIILWDYWLAFFVSRWKKTYGKASGLCFDVIAGFELLLSLSVLGKVRKCNVAEIDTDSENVYLEGEKLYHPLINPDFVVPNSVKLNGGVTIITGSNMSGKTTFLRTLAINLVLAYMGAPVCGDSFKASFMKIFTSMRITDDIAGGISTFYAEILRIKAMADYRKKNLPMVCLIDEIFKGTNSADRIVGAEHVITRLGSKSCMTVVSTHDFELCTLRNEEGREASNYHFEEYYENEQLKFDYSIKSGRCTTTNAREILRMAGFDIQN